MKKPLLGLFVLCALLSGCQATLPQFWPSLEEEGEVYLYLQPFSQEAQRLSFSLDAITAISSDGKEIPLSVSLRELRGGDIKGQRLLATGVLPAGDYSGFSFRTMNAYLKGEGGESALRVPESSSMIDFKFSVIRRKGYVLSLMLRYAESVQTGFSFNPAFSIYFPDRPAVGLMGFVANNRSNDITVFNKRSLQVFDVITTSRGPSGMALDQRSRRAYVALSGEDSVDVIDIAAGTISDRIRLNPGDEPWELALTPDGRTLLSANRGSNTVSIIDTSARVEVTKIRVGNGPSSIVIDQTGRRAFVVNNLSNSISVLDIPGGGLTTSIVTDPGPVRAQFNRRGDKLYVIHELSPYIGVINPTLLVAAGRFPVRSGMIGEKIDTNTDLVYLARKRDFVVGIFDPLSFAAVGFVNTGASVVQMTIDGDENTLFMVSPDTKRILVSTLIGNRMVGQLDVGEGPYWVTLMGER